MTPTQARELLRVTWMQYEWNRYNFDAICLAHYLLAKERHEEEDFLAMCATNALSNSSS
mgnify:CR=1 FL=1